MGFDDVDSAGSNDGDCVGVDRVCVGSDDGCCIRGALRIMVGAPVGSSDGVTVGL